jgi:hypothetical protein
LTQTRLPLACRLQRQEIHPSFVDADPGATILRAPSREGISSGWPTDTSLYGSASGVAPAQVAGVALGAGPGPGAVGAGGGGSRLTHGNGAGRRQAAGTLPRIRASPRVPADEAIRQAREGSATSKRAWRRRKRTYFRVPSDATYTFRRRLARLERRQAPGKPCKSGSGRCWARTNDLRLVETESGGSEKARDGTNARRYGRNAGLSSLTVAVSYPLIPGRMYDRCTTPR